MLKSLNFILTIPRKRFSMGIRGLTTFVAQYSDKFLQPHELHSTYLVLDGNNICCQLYMWHSKLFDCFGGDYDTYTRVIETFFNALAKCYITPIVVFDGNYEWKKLKTIFARYRDRTKTAGQLTAGTEQRCKVFPLFTRVLFTDVVKRLNVHVYRCELEADNELACLARALNCPVLSYDSDFYIFDVLYIPFNSLNFVPRYNTYRNIWYLPCELYKTENFLKSFSGLRREHLPLIATLLGNDYIKASIFHKFYSQLKLQSSKSCINLQQRRIRTVIQWLRTETFESAVCKILNRIKMFQRKNIAKKIDIIVKGYVCCESVILRDLDIKYKPRESRAFELKYNLDDLIENCNKVGNLLDTYLEWGEEEISDENDELKDSEEEDVTDKEDEAVSSFKNIPSWFVRKHYLCEYPSLIYEIAHNIFFFCKPQVEDYSNKPSYSICFSVISAINKILTQTIYGQERLLKTVGRNENDGVIKFLLPSFKKEVVSLNEIPTLLETDRIDFMLHVLDLSFFKYTLDEFPADWKLLLVCIIFWIKNSNAQIKSSHIFSIFLCAIILKIVDKKLGAIRMLTKLRNKFSKLLNTKQPTNTMKSTNPNNLEDFFNAISTTESAFAMSVLIPSFDLSDKIARNHKQFDIQIVDSFAQLQSCIYYISALNYLLNEPFDNLIISDFYNGTFLYNLCTIFKKRTDVVAYLKQWLPNSPNIVNACLKLEQLVGAKFSVVTQRNKIKKRKKAGKNKKVGNVRNTGNADGGIKNEKFVDKNNSYGILSTCD